MTFIQTPRVARKLLALSLLLGCAARTASKNAATTSTSTAALPANKAEVATAVGFTGKPGDPFEPPSMPPPQAFPIQSMTRFALRNGLRVVVVLSRDLPTVDVRLSVRVGQVDEPATMSGLSAFVAEMLRQGTATRSADEISERIDAAGASLEALAEEERTIVHCGGLSKSLRLCLELLADVVISPAFPENEMSEVADRMIASIEQVRDDKDALSEWHFANQLYGDSHPLGRVTTEHDIVRIRQQDLKAFHDKYFVPANALLTVAGNVDPARIRRQIEKVFAAWSARSVPNRTEPPVPAPREIRVLLVDKPDLEQTRILLGHPGLRRKDADFEAAELANYTLGGGAFSSRLMDRLRSKGGKTYGIRSSFGHSSWLSQFSIEVDVPHAHVGSTLSEILEEMRRMKATGPTPSELLAAKAHIAWSYPLSLQTPAEIADALIRAEIYGLPGDYVETAPLRINAVPLAQVQQAAKHRFHPGQLIVVLVGKAASLRADLEKMSLRFEQISYLDPIAASARKQAKASP